MEHRNIKIRKGPIWWLALLVFSILAAGYGFYWFSGLLIGFAVGVWFGVARIYKKVMKERLDSNTMEEIFDKIL